jgi:hypothetical protein
VTVDEATTCEDPAPAPTAFCYTQWNTRLIDETGQVTASVLEGVFEVLANGLIQAAASGGTQEPAHRYEEAANRQESHPAPRHEPAHEERPHRDYRPAKPHKE